VWVTEYLLGRSKLVETMEVNASNLRGWLLALNGAYLKNPYHNAMHGADVCQTLWCLIENQGHVNHTKLALNNKTKFAALLSAAAHDVGHAGFNNNYLINSEVSGPRERSEREGRFSVAHQSTAAASTRVQRAQKKS
jgi:hypothetical protein